LLDTCSNYTFEAHSDKGMAESGGLVGGQGFEVMKQVEVLARERAVELSDWARMSAACLAMRGGQFEDALNYDQ